MASPEARRRARRRAARADREAMWEREAGRALAINPRLLGHRLYARCMRALFAGDSTRRLALWFAGLGAVTAIAWVVARVLGDW